LSAISSDFTFYLSEEKALWVYQPANRIPLVSLPAFRGVKKKGDRRRPKKTK
jgi:hypothetical protein